MPENADESSEIRINRTHLPRLRADAGAGGLRNDFRKQTKLFPAHDYERNWRDGWVVYGDLIGIGNLTSHSSMAPLNQITKFQALTVEAATIARPSEFRQFSDSSFAVFGKFVDALRFASRAMHTCMALNADTIERRAVSSFHEMIVPTFGIAYGRYFIGRIADDEDAEENAAFRPLRVIVGDAITRAVRQQEGALMGTISVEALPDSWEAVGVEQFGKNLPVKRWLDAHLRALRNESPEKHNQSWNSLRLVGDMSGRFDRYSARPHPPSVLFPWMFCSANQTRRHVLAAGDWPEYGVAYDNIRQVVRKWVDSFYVASGSRKPRADVAKHGLGFARWAVSHDTAARFGRLMRPHPSEWHAFLSIHDDADPSP